MTVEMIVKATRLLAGVCDGAQRRDGCGYNALDTQFMHSLAVQATPHTPKQVRIMWNVLRKYRKQLQECGINYDALIPPPVELPKTREADEVAVSLAWNTHPKYGRSIKITFPYQPQIVKAMQEVKTVLNGAAWFIYDEQFWRVRDEIESFDVTVAALEETGAHLEIPAEMTAHYDATRKERAEALTASRAEAADGLAQVCKLPLLPFQLAGVQYVEAHNGRALIGDEMGLGKTPQAIDYLVRHPEARPALIVVPATLIVNWTREIKKFSDLTVSALVAKSNVKRMVEKLGIPSDTKPMTGYDVTLVNYDVLKDDLEALRAFGFKTLILDEAHYIKEEKSARTKAVIGARGEGKKKTDKLGLAQTIERVILLTGTPFLNRPREIWTLTQALDRKIFPGFFGFAKKFCNPEHNGYGWDFNGASNLEELDRILRERVMVRREKMQVLKELPEKRRVTVPLTINGDLKSYEDKAAPILEALRDANRTRKEWKAKLAGMTEDERKTYLADHAEEVARMGKLTGLVISEIGKLRVLAAKAKMDAAVERVENMMEQTPKLAVFVHHHEITDALVERLSKSGLNVVKVDGREDAVKRQAAIDAFQSGNAQVAVLGIMAASVGLTLTASSNVLFFELPWRPGDVEQGEARVWRYGQKNAVTSWFFVALGTIEESMAKMLDVKREVTNAAVGEGERTVEEEGILDALLDDIQEAK